VSQGRPQGRTNLAFASPFLERQVFPEICVSYLEASLKSLNKLKRGEPGVNR